MTTTQIAKKMLLIKSGQIVKIKAGGAKNPIRLYWPDDDTESFLFPGAALEKDLNRIVNTMVNSNNYKLIGFSAYYHYDAKSDIEIYLLQKQ